MSDLHSARALRTDCAAFLLLITLILAGCSTHPTTPDLDALPPPPADLSPWQASGKLAIRSEQESETARFIWRRPHPGEDDFTLSGPLAINSIHLKREGSEIFTLISGEKRPIQESIDSPTWLSILAQLSGEDLGSWLLGAAPTTADWHVVAEDWRSQPPWRLPSRVTIDGSGYEIRIIISEWDITATP